MMEKRDFLTLGDLSSAEVETLIERALALKSGADKARCPLTGRSVGLIFEKSSTRTRVSFETGIYQLGGQTIYINAMETQMGRGETVADTASILSRYLDAIVIRTYAHDKVRQFAAHSRVPVINGLSDMHHPCQALGDMLTIREKKGRLRGIRLAYIGDGNNVAHSLIEAAVIAGMELSLACPPGYGPDGEILMRAQKEAPGRVTLVENPKEAAQGADALYTDVWVSMGMEKESDERKKIFIPYQINSALLSVAAPDAIVMHCLPAHRGEEITDEVMDGQRSVVFDQAENRLHSQKALLEFLLS